MNNVKNNGTVNGKKYKCIFFDLDHTLWDYETNSAETLSELYLTYDLLSKGVPRFQDFLNRFKKVNTDLWNLYDRGLIDSEVIRKERFKQILEPFDAYEFKLARIFPATILTSVPVRQSYASTRWIS
jgi:putative hydrolase of the HAD superfamily